MATLIVDVSGYYLIYFLLVIVVFFILYLGFSRVINELECLAIALTVGTIWLAINYYTIVNYYRPFVVFCPSNPTIPLCEGILPKFQLLIIGTPILITLNFLIILLAGISLITFNKTRHCDIFKF